MYDTETADLLRSVPAVGDLDTESLPERLTEAYSIIVAARLTAAEGESISERGQELRRIASSYEALAAAGTSREHREASAFLSASAHELLYRAASVGAYVSRPRSVLSMNAISSDVSAMLLFLIAGYPSDAHEIAREIAAESESPVQAALLWALKHLGQGALESILEAPEPDSIRTVVEDPTQRAVEHLWLELLRGIRSMVSRILSTEAATGPGAEEVVAPQFDRVRDLASRVVDVDLGGTTENGDRTVIRTFAGPYHLALLLASGRDGLMGRALTGVDPPPDVDGGPWRTHLGRVARKRPYLWSNHRHAIDAGLLRPGVSAAISFPTGAGKSSLAELKIAAAICRDMRVVFLAPTHALVWQQIESLRSAFPETTVGDSLVSGGFYSEVELFDAPEIAVMTPERCLMIMSADPGALSDVGLIVFDECHLLHPQEGIRDRRSLDAMLCLLRLTDLAPQADYLLMSAMMANDDEIANWLRQLTGRECLALHLEWKPTRQVRGCVVYPNERLEELKTSLVDARGRATTKGPPTALRRTLTARPIGFFGLRHSWSTRRAADYSDVWILDEDVQLAASLRWSLTGNTNEVAAALASRMARVGIRTLVFVQNRDHCLRIAQATAERVSGEVPAVELTGAEREWREAAVEDLGHEDHLLGPVLGCAAPHHGLLLPSERRLNESLFAREGGLPVLVATPTLAQGMNLPAEAVIIAGDGRFDAETGRQAQLAAHELLNAAGRAGRAGHRASGFVLVVPSQVVGLDTENRRIGAAWTPLRENVFSKSDQCLKIGDPIELLLDSIQQSGRPEGDLEGYFVARLPAVTEEAGGEASRRFLGKSLAAFRAERDEITSTYQEKVETAVRARSQLDEEVEEPRWIRDVAAASGIEPQQLKDLHEALESDPIGTSLSVDGCLAWLEAWLGQSRPRLDVFLNRRRLASALTKDEFDALPYDYDSRTIVTTVFDRLRAWMRGATLRDLELMLGTAENKLGYCKRARIFWRDVALDLSYAAGLVTQVRRAQLGGLEGEDRIPTSLATLGACVREGFDDPEKLAIYYRRRPTASRVACHRIHGDIVSEIPGGDPLEPFSATRARVRSILG